MESDPSPSLLMFDGKLRDLQAVIAIVHSKNSGRCTYGLAINLSPKIPGAHIRDYILRTVWLTQETYNGDPAAV